MAGNEQATQQDAEQSAPARLPEARAVYKGRLEITTKRERVDASNVVDVLQEVWTAHTLNCAQIEYLWNYYRGQQPILERVKDVRPEICNKVVENHAQEIVAFKIGYQLAEPLQYTCRSYGDQVEGSDDPLLKDVAELNTLMFAEDKASCDRDLFEWMCIGGVGYRMCAVDKAYDVEEGGAPFEITTLDPRWTFVVRDRSERRRVLMGVWVGVDPEDGTRIFNCWTDSKFFRVRESGWELVKDAGHTYGRIPIVEYRLNNARMGVFEPVLPLLDAINAVESNRLDGIEQTVQALMKFVNCQVSESEFVKMLQLGAVEVTTTEGAVGPADVDLIRNDLDQTQTQVTKDDLYASVVRICGMPNLNGTSGSSSDTGAAVLLRDGWTMAESHAKSYELQFKRAERDFLRVALSICRQSKDCSLDLRIRDIELAFNRRNYENILTKSQVLTTMLSTGKVHPELAFQACGLFTDPEAAYLRSKDYEEAQPSPVSPPFPGEGGVGSQANQPEPEGNDGSKGPSA